MSDRTSPNSSSGLARRGDLATIRASASRPSSRSRNRGPLGEGGRPRASLRERRGIRIPGRHQPLRFARAHARSARHRIVRGLGRAARLLPRPEAAGRAPGKVEGLAEDRRSRFGLSEDGQECALPGDRRDRRRRRSRKAPGPPVLASGRGSLHHHAAGHYARSGHRPEQRRHVPNAALRPEHDRDALAEAQGRRGTGAGVHAGGPAHGSRRRDRRRPGDDLLGDRAASPRHFGAPARRFPEGGERSRGPGQDRRRDGAGRGGVRPRRLPGSGRDAARRALRRSHRLLLAGRRFPGLPRDRRDAACAAGLRDDDRRPAADGGRFHGGGRRAALPPARSKDDSRRRGHVAPRRRHLPQPDDRLDRQALSGAGAEGHARHLGNRPDDVHEDDRRRGRRLQRPRSGGSRLEGAQPHRPAARLRVRARPDRRARSRLAGAVLRVARRHRRDEKAPGRGLPPPLAGRDRQAPEVRAKIDRLWPALFPAAHSPPGGRPRSSPGGILLAMRRVTTSR